MASSEHRHLLELNYFQEQAIHQPSLVFIVRVALALRDSNCGSSGIMSHCLPRACRRSQEMGSSKTLLSIRLLVNMRATTACLCILRVRSHVHAHRAQSISASISLVTRMLATFLLAFTELVFLHVLPLIGHAFALRFSSSTCASRTESTPMVSY